MRRLMYVDRDGCCDSTALLILRVVVGAAFVLHGLPKVKNLTGWMGPDMPGAVQALAAIAEFGGGIALILGLLTPLAALGIAGVMVGALSLVHVKMGHPFVSADGGPSCELATVYLACAILFLAMGPGRWSIDALLFGRKGAGCPTAPDVPRA